MILLLLLVTLGVVGAGAWWLSGYDSKLTGDDPQADAVRRGIRCGITLLLAGAAAWNLFRWWLYGDRASGFVYLGLALPLALTWVGCLSEVSARGFQRLLFPEDQRAADLGETNRALDELAGLVRLGKREEALRLCARLAEEGNVSRLTLETVLGRMGLEPAAAGLGEAKTAGSLQQAAKLREAGKLLEAEEKLTAALVQNPSDQAAALMLMQLYAQDLHQWERAQAVLTRMAEQKHIPPAFLEYAQRSIHEWAQPPSEKAREEPGVEALLLPESPGQTARAAPPPARSIEEMLAQGYYGTAIEWLDQQAKARPHDFELQMKLAEAHGVYCGNLSRATKIVERIESNPAFSTEQIQQAKAELKAWKAKPVKP